MFTMLIFALSFNVCNDICISMLVTCYLTTLSLCSFNWLASTLFISIVFFVFSLCLV